MAVTLGEEIMLLSLDDESGAAKQRQAVGWAVAGGIVLDLVMAGRLSVERERMTVDDPAPTGVGLLDERLRLVEAWAAGRRRPPKVTEWLTKDRDKAVRAAVASLRERGLVSEEQRKVLGLVPVRRFPQADGAVERTLRDRLTAVVVDGAEPDERTVGLIALIQGAGLHRLAFPGLPRKEVTARMKEIAEGQWAGESVRKAVRDMEAAMVAVTVVTTMS